MALSNPPEQSLELTGAKQSKPAFLYLHGFASSPKSRKATFFKERLEQLGHRCLVPDLNVPSFKELTLSAQLSLIEKLRPLLADQIVIIGSSMGGLLAALLATSTCGRNEATSLTKSPQLSLPGIRAIILMAPGFGITKRWRELVGVEGMAAWQETGYRKYFHYAVDKNLDLHWGFIEDLKQHPAEVQVDIPTLLLHGIHDETVPIEHSRQFAKQNSGAKLVELEDGHELGDSLEQIWSHTVTFLQLESANQDQ